MFYPMNAKSRRRDARVDKRRHEELKGSCSNDDLGFFEPAQSKVERQE